MSSMMVPSRSRKTARRAAHSRSASASAAPTAAKLSSGSVRGSSRTRPPPTRATTDGLAHPEPEREAVGTERAGVERHQRRRKHRARETSRRRPRTRPARASGRELGGAGRREPAGAAGRAPRRRAVSMRSTGISRTACLGLAVERERGLQPRERHLVGPDRAGDRVLAAARHRAPGARRCTPPAVRRAACRR